MNCDTELEAVRFERSPDEMDLEAGAGVFVGQAGLADPDKFLVCGFPIVLAVIVKCGGNGIFVPKKNDFLRRLSSQSA